MKKIKSSQDYQKAKELLDKCYEESEHNPKKNKEAERLKNLIEKYEKKEKTLSQSTEVSMGM